MGRTSLAPDSPGHIHYIEGITTFNDGHMHMYRTSTSVGFPAPAGGHYHVFSTIAQPAQGHIHFISDNTSAD